MWIVWLQSEGMYRAVKREKNLANSNDQLYELYLQFNYS